MAIGSHQSAKAVSEVWLTPPEVLKKLGTFDLDPCAAPLPRPWSTATNHYVEADDGLSKEWSGRCWLNPPYGRKLHRWMAKLSAHGIGTALIFARTETRAFFDTVWNSDTASAILFLDGRLHFHKPDGTRAKANAGAPSCLIAYGRDDAEILHDCGIAGRFLPLCVQTTLWVGLNKLKEASITWKELVLGVVEREGGKVSLSDIYNLIANHPKAKANRHWKAKVRQTVARAKLQRVGNAQYEMAV